MDLRADWSNPPKDILELIFENLKDPSDLLHCHGVCRSWYSVSKHFSSQHIKNLPPLIIFSEPLQTNEGSTSNSSNTSDRKMFFYSCHSRNRCTFSIPFDLQESWLSGGPYGWVISTQSKKPYELYLMNCVSHALIRLPNVGSNRYINKLRLIMSANPASDPDCTFLDISPPRKSVLLCRLGNTYWRKLSIKDMSDYGAATFYEGHFYIYKRNGIILKIDVRTCRVSKLITEAEEIPQDREEVRRIEECCRNSNRDDYLMESNGELLHISKCIRRTGETEVKVCKLDHQRNIWVEIDDLGNNALFMGYNNSITVHVPTTTGEEYGRSMVCRANCIYFIDDSDYTVENQVSSGGERRGLYDMKSREYKGWITGLRPIWFNAPLSWIRPEVQQFCA